MGERTLRGKRVAVVGASAGIGRAFAVRAGKEGAELLVAARRQGRLEEVVAEAGRGSTVTADVRNADDCARIAAAARDTLGGIDLLFISVGYAPLRMFVDTSAADWFDVMQTNVVSIHQVIRACLPALTPGAIVGALSSETVGQPRLGLGAYSTSKAALNESLNAWRTEHPDFRFCCVTVGGTVPTEFTAAFDTELLGTVVQDWIARGLLQETLMTPDEVADMLAGVFASALNCPVVSPEQLVLRPPAAVVKPAMA
ncbi:SDR family NAD(P)-dependent oxidoreductase [Mycobacterium bourgelatii]|uniref:Oxidoreductase n=1 Tax=Mycobacterium bourgelatii TaxID=1273442 RepID=A0A7I9YKH4_MYCBU|nr:SDR family oxidoreductase [Mycobacterium bourgelatii]MCV6974693.1 SDR family oxidoreductase [Mycobacterium bourgelatii]GFG89160.1 oxidoreductase [Mycobacterium bourgelatii]